MTRKEIVFIVVFSVVATLASFFISSPVDPTVELNEDANEVVDSANGFPFPIVARTVTGGCTFLGEDNSLNNIACGSADHFRIDAIGLAGNLVFYGVAAIVGYKVYRASKK
jgi:hypothetical protein